jgi:hypothetical protein
MHRSKNENFTYNINEQVFIKGDWETIYIVIKKNGRKYQIQTDGFINNTWYDDSVLTNSRKSNFLKSLREAKLKLEQEQQENKSLTELVIKDVYQYINWDPKNRPCKVLFTEDPLAPMRVFYWVEEDYQGSIFVVYEYIFQNKTFYLCLSSGFGSCTGCDDWEHILEMRWVGEDNTQVKRDHILREYNNLYIETDKNNIILNKKYMQRSINKMD